jgi:SAM-dependent methyltransferase
VLSKGVDIPVEPGTIDCAFSTQVLEHIHPDDALQHVQNVVRSLKVGGKYVCKTPHRFSGPHDVSGHFDLEATGLHLKEYTLVEIKELFRRGGLRRCVLYMGGKGYYLPVPFMFALWIERLLGIMSLKFRQRIGRFFLVRALLGITIVGYKI